MVFKLDPNGQRCGSLPDQTCANFVVGGVTAEDASAGATSLAVSNAAAFPPSGSIRVGVQQVSYTTASDTVLDLGLPLAADTPSGTTVALRIGAIHSSPALTSTRLYFGSDDHNLYACDSETGALIWTLVTDGAIESSPAVATGAQADDPTVVVVGSDDGNVYFVEDDGTTAPPVATFAVGAPVRSSPAIDADGTVYVGADNGTVYAIR
jgi:outer membrane protein assembly factor BamB